MDPPTYHEVMTESLHSPSMATAVIHNRAASPDRGLWDGKVRCIIGTLQIIFGSIELVLGVVAIINQHLLKEFDYVGWGIWHGLFSVSAGCISVLKPRTKAVARMYVGTSIITVILCIDCFIYSAVFVLLGGGTLYIIMSIVFFLQTAVSGIGASVACGALCSMNELTQESMNPPSYAHVEWQIQQSSSITQGLPNNTACPGGKCCKLNVRRIMGIVQIVVGEVEMILGVAVIFIPETSLYVNQDYVGWGIWHGVFAVLSGLLGAYSGRKKCQVMAYTITSIITAVLCAGCFSYAVFKAFLGGVYSDTRYVNLRIYIILSIVFLIQMVISVIGAILSCDSGSFLPQFDTSGSNNSGVTCESQQTLAATSDAFSNSTRPSEKFSGGKVRRVMGILQVIFGGIGCGLAMVVIYRPDCTVTSFSGKEYFSGGWGVSSGVFTIVSGLIGFFSVKKECVIRTYMMVSIITGVMCADSLVFAISGGVFYRWFQNDSCNEDHLKKHISLCIVLLIQMIISSIGASFSCVASGSTTHQHQQSVEYTLPPLSQQQDPLPPYTVGPPHTELASHVPTQNTSGPTQVPTIQSTI